MTSRCVRLQQRHTIPGNTSALQDLGLTTATASDAHSQVYKFMNHLYLTGPNIHHLLNLANVSNTLNFRLLPSSPAYLLTHLQAQQEGLLTHNSQCKSKDMEQRSEQSHIIGII